MIRVRERTIKRIPEMCTYAYMHTHGGTRNGVYASGLVLRYPLLPSRIARGVHVKSPLPPPPPQRLLDVANWRYMQINAGLLPDSLSRER